MTRSLRSYVCEECGEPVIRPRRVDRRKLHAECSIRRMTRDIYRRSAAAAARRAVLARQRKRVVE